MVMQRMHGVPISQIEARPRATISRAVAGRRRDFLHAGVPRRFLPCRHAPWQYLRTCRRPLHRASTSASWARSTKSTRTTARRTSWFLQARLQARRDGPPRSRLGAGPHLVDEFESAIRRSVSRSSTSRSRTSQFRPYLLRLFQTARRFEMEVQPQLVLLQKPCSIEGLGRQLDPDLDL